MDLLVGADAPKDGYLIVNRRCCSKGIFSIWLPRKRHGILGSQDSGAGVARAWRGRGAGCRQILGLGGAGVARAWRRRGAGMSCDHWKPWCTFPGSSVVRFVTFAGTVRNATHIACSCFAGMV
eukprot:gene12989-biopygen16989